MTDEEFRLLRNIIYQESGIYLREERRSFLQSRLRQRLRATGISSPYRYYKVLTDPEAGKQEFLLFLDLLTINETSFFRNPAQFALLKEVVLPAVIKAKSAQDTRILRLWSAGCSTGQEPYSLAMILLSVLPHLRLWDVKIYASDISLTALEVAQEGVYPPDKVAGVDPISLQTYFRQAGDNYVVKEELRRHVIFDLHNLKHENGLTNLDIIFCRNVMIYFDQAEQKRLVEKFCHSLTTGGYLFLGHAESLHGLSDKFRFLHHNKGTAYQKMDLPQADQEGSSRG
ncbi:MAG: CheR family methyltransferase [Candidatus Methylomirabilales bacterium]